MIYLLAISAGIFSVAFYPALPSLESYVIWLSLISLVWVAIEYSKLSIMSYALAIFRLSLMLGWGTAWGFYCAHGVLDHQLPDTLDRHDFLVTGTIAKVLKVDKLRTNFEVAVHTSVLMEDQNQSIYIKKLLLNDYSSMAKTGPLNIREGEHWQLVVRLKRPRGTINPGGFDYQSWLIQRGYSATGYVKHNPLNYQQERNEASVTQRALFRVGEIRSAIREAIIRSDLSDLGGAILVALTVGDKTQIRPWWESLTRLGIVHLLVISGLHVGLVAAGGFMIGTSIVKALSSLSYIFPIISKTHVYLRFMPSIFAIVVAAGYSLLAGFTLPTQRALIAIVIVMAAKLAYRRITPWACLGWTLLIIAAWQPLAILSAGFWLSFTAVATLIGWFYPWVSSDTSFRKKRAITAQIALLCLMSLPLFVFLGRISWLSPLVNIMAIPLVSLLTVPLALFGIICLVFSERIAGTVWALADWSTTPIQWLLDIVPSSYGFLSLPVIMDWKVLLALLMACVALLLPIPKVYKLISMLPLSLALLAPNDEVNFQLTVLDVGQGLAAVIEFGDNTLIYDTGPRYSGSFDAGAGIVVPYLNSRARRSINKIIISHEDSDHSGGALSVIGALRPDSMLVGPGFFDRLNNSTEASNQKMKYAQCVAGQKWLWPSSLPHGDFNTTGSAQFEVIWPTIDGPKEGNNSSCVLQITWHDQVILLTGDIEASAERRIIKDRLMETKNLSLLVAPHHGSKTSSTDQFVRSVRPKHVIFSSGYRHHFGHPHPAVVRRYAAVGTRVWKTAEKGAVTFRWDQSGKLDVSSARDQVFPSCLTCTAWWR